MNKQQKRNKNGSIGRGIEWTDYTWNPIAGCFHACQWTMPDGAIANCYAEDVAHKVAQAAYPEGFEHHYWKPEALNEPRRVKTPSKIFAGSMADNFGHWVPLDQLQQVIRTVIDTHWHVFQFLTKNPKRIINDNIGLPKNAWIGASTPPDYMWNKSLSLSQKERLLHNTLEVLSVIAEKPRVTWMSAEPLSWDVVPILEQYTKPLSWIVIGAASNGKTYYPPEEKHVRSLVEWCDSRNVKVFFKGNMKSLEWAKNNWREEFPTG